ncbi:sulfotransferase family 2 domain-containing protein [Formosa algae]|uniref:Sulfotransferase family protein n=1 Tax=Formosa algae TaxID=225843 RepID=A0A9X1C8V3_9FLAO|nr:sulfotransferase family 2 domain-containing protein [Formosa algae]MBP1839118.1 hypothetical protein [Formosa algae]MDQ0333895.1 hypothetical protein [Formosa algae]
MLKIKEIFKTLIPSPFKEYLLEYNRRRFCIKLYKEKEQNNPGNYYSYFVFDYYKCIFIHLPKSAGIAVNLALFGNYGGGHRSLRFYEKKYPKRTIDEYYKCTIVRNPWDRLFSAYNFLKKGGFSVADKEWAEKHLIDFVSFEDFVLNWVNKENIYKGVHFIPQYDFLINSEGKVNMDFIGRFEDMENSFRVISEHINGNSVLEKHNVTDNKSPYYNFYTEKMIEIVEDVYEKDIKEFNYKFKP